MKNIFTILKEFEIELPEDKQKDFEKAVLENYRTVADYDKQKEKLAAAEDKVRTTEETLKKFDGVDLEGMKKQIEELKGDLEKKESDYQSQLADRDFNALLKESISTAKGKNVKAITALLDLEALKASKNQKADIGAALKALTEAEDSKMLFGEPQAASIGTGNIIGQVQKPAAQQTDTLKGAIAEHYKEQ